MMNLRRLYFISTNKVRPSSREMYRAIKYVVRKAQFVDVDRIQECNLANLPENYRLNFFSNHIAKWPDLSFIAETNEKEMVGKLVKSGNAFLVTFCSIGGLCTWSRRITSSRAIIII